MTADELNGILIIYIGEDRLGPCKRKGEVEDEGIRRCCGGNRRRGHGDASGASGAQVSGQGNSGAGAERAGRGNCGRGVSGAADHGGGIRWSGRGVFRGHGRLEGRVPAMGMGGGPARRGGDRQRGRLSDGSPGSARGSGGKRGASQKRQRVCGESELQHDSDGGGSGSPASGGDAQAGGRGHVSGRIGHGKKRHRGAWPAGGGARRGSKDRRHGVSPPDCVQCDPADQRSDGGVSGIFRRRDQNDQGAPENL